MGLVKREKALHAGRWTYVLKLSKRPVEIGLIEDIYCFICPYEHKCTARAPQYLKKCKHIADWVLKKYQEALKPSDQNAGKRKEMAPKEKGGPLLQKSEERRLPK